MRYRKKPVVVEAIQITDEWFDGRHPNQMGAYLGWKDNLVNTNP